MKGLALHLLSSWTHAALPLHSTPEIRRAPLEQVVLQAMAGGYTAVSSGEEMYVCVGGWTCVLVKWTDEMKSTPHPTLNT